MKALNERAAIAMIPSKWREPFGRTCLEAHAGGAAVISSGSGGLREISGDAALYATDAEVDGLIDALRRLIDRSRCCASDWPRKDASGSPTNSTCQRSRRGSMTPANRPAPCGADERKQHGD